ncbi:RES domain-containing protein [Bradyrhizobium sp. SZCCHNS2015]|uniref:RES domain-containing protein n=1 Tax=Bradyrhizobium sp. SZCCHNS2015 TaxID=3057305 RepID=UPI0028E4F59A|nr:RES domain-containing protein [Bradyrhizobium sp. SZCCHNS2015]
MSDSNSNICAACVGNPRFAGWIRKHGTFGKCDLDPDHKYRRKVVKLKEFAESVNDYFRENYTSGEEEPYATEDSDNVSYRQLGLPYKEILMDDLECSDEVVDAIADELPDAAHREIAQGEQPFYDSSNYYEPVAAIRERRRREQEEYWYENRFAFQWQDFCEKVQYERRFFKIKEPLDELFGNPEEYEAGTIRPVYILRAGEMVFRARLLDDGFTEESLKKNPSKELGAPPREKVRAGRMNVEYIPAFYAAFSKETAIAEIRPGIGEDVAIGEFELRRDLRIFDFTAFSRAKDEDWSEAYRHTRYEFIHQLEDEISKPILPYEKQREYIATQIVAEYLKEYFGCDAVIYRSSMIKGRSKESCNIVILNRGDSFVGDTCDLTYRRHEVQQIANIVYQLEDIRF